MKRVMRVGAICALVSMGLVACTGGKARNEQKAVVGELSEAYTSAIKAYAETGKMPSNLEAAEFEPTDKSVKIEYERTPAGFQITGSKGSTKLTINDKKQLFDEDMNPITGR